MDDLTAFVAARLGEREHFAKIARLAQKHREQLLREVEADRKLLSLCVQVISDDAGHEFYSDGWSGLTVAQRTVRQLAAVYSGHPGYRQEWKP